MFSLSRWLLNIFYFQTISIISIVISINDSLTPPTIPFEHKNVLTLFFDDVSCDTERAKMLGLTPFSITIASKIVDFISSINENNRTDNTLIVHCGAGVSRSGAVASFIADMYGYTREKLLLENPMIKPNTDVLATLKREFYKRSGMFS